jgi:hypothetical protein
MDIGGEGSERLPPSMTPHEGEIRKREMNAAINIRPVLTEEEAMGIIPSLLVEGCLRRIALSRRKRAYEVEGEAESVLQDALSDGDMGGGGAMNLFLDAEQLRKEAAALEEAAAAVERAMRLVMGEESPVENF